MGETITLTCKDGVQISAYRARPQGRPKGGMVVLQEIFGVNHHIRAVADKYAAAGYLSIAPALFDRVEKGVELGYGMEDRPRAMDLRGRTKLAETLADVAAAIEAAKEGGKVGVVGYCWGGTLAYAAACRLPGVAAAVGYYGGGIAGIASEKPRIPLMLHFGEHDAITPPAVARQMHERFRGSELVIVPGAGHMAPMEAPQVVSAEMARWLAG